MFSVRTSRQLSHVIFADSSFTTAASTSKSYRQFLALTPQPQQFVEKRNFTSDVPAYIKPIFQYGSDAFITQGLQAGLEALQSTGVTPVVSFVVMGITLRVVTAPAHFFSEKLLAKRVHIVNFLTQNILKKIGEQLKLNVIYDGAKMALDTTDSATQKKAHVMVGQQINEFCAREKVQKSRILNLKTMTLPIWFYSSFAIRNVINSEFKPVYEGFLWIHDFTDPDPYFIVPICVGFLGFFNIYAQRVIYPRTLKIQNVYDGALIAMTLVAVKMMTLLPVCIPLYWLTVSATGILQSQMLRHPKFKKLLGINRLPTDSSTPFRDLFFLRRNRGGAPQSML